MRAPGGARPLNAFEPLAHVDQAESLVSPRVGPDDQLQHTPRPVPKLRAERVLVVAREASHDLLEMKTQVIAPLVDRQMLGLGHPRERLGGGAPQTPLKESNDSKGQIINHGPPRTARARPPAVLKLAELVKPLPKKTNQAVVGSTASDVDDQ